jgi:hypothetical protein
MELTLKAVHGLQPRRASINLKKIIWITHHVGEGIKSFPTIFRILYD